MKKILRLMALLTAVAFAPLFGQERDGFFAAMSIGWGSTTVFSENISGNQTLLKGGLALASKFGYAPNNHVQIQMSFASSIFRMKQLKSDVEKVKEIPGAIMLTPFLAPFVLVRSSHTMIGLIGATYYFEPRAPSFLIGAGIGVSALAEPFWDETKGGFGFWTEGGCEFAKHVSAKLTLFYGKAEHTIHRYFIVQSSALSSVVTLEFCLY